jgi:hypothetical protein
LIALRTGTQPQSVQTNEAFGVLLVVRATVVLEGAL